MAFRFPLETILRLRRGQEQAERLKLEAIISEQRQIRARLDEMIEHSVESRRRFQQEITEGVSGSQLRFQATRQANVLLVRATLESRLSQLENNRLAQIQIFYMSRQRREILENLRLHKFEVYAQEEARREQQDLDDLFVMKTEIVLGESE
jgi:flagellar export protein FliJ